MSLKLKKENP